MIYTPNQQEALDYRDGNLLISKNCVVKLIGQIEVDQRLTILHGQAAELADPPQPFCYGVAVKIEVLRSLGRGTAAFYIGPQSLTVFGSVFPVVVQKDAILRLREGAALAVCKDLSQDREKHILEAKDSLTLPESPGQSAHGQAGLVVGTQMDQMREGAAEKDLQLIVRRNPFELRFIVLRIPVSAEIQQEQ